MKTAEKASRILAILEELYPDPPIPLDHGSTFQLLVAVVLSAQTTDKKVNQVTPELFRRAPDPAGMAKLTVDEVRDLIREVGLAPQKAKALVGLSQALLHEHGGEVPSDFDALIALPGVGRKTAQVVQAQAFGLPAFPVDTHIHRLAGRWGLSRGKSPDATEADLKRIFPTECWSKLHLQIIMFGRERCPALHHDLKACRICGWAATKKRVLQEGARRKPASAKTAAGSSKGSKGLPESSKAGPKRSEAGRRSSESGRRSSEAGAKIAKAGPKESKAAPNATRGAAKGPKDAPKGPRAAAPRPAPEPSAKVPSRRPKAVRSKSTKARPRVTQA
ncbi:MAG: endonuclease III [Myxococcota bacterium]